MTPKATRVFAAMLLAAAAMPTERLWALPPAGAPAESTPHRPEADPPSVHGVLAGVSSRYRKSMTCERINVEVRPEFGRTARSIFTLRLDPRGDDQSGAVRPAVALELGSLRLLAETLTGSTPGGRLTAVHTRNPGTYFRTEIAGRGTLASTALSVLPPLPLPQLDLALWNPSSESPVAMLTPYARRIQWEGAAADPRQPQRVTLKGRCEGGTITLVARGDVLQSVEITSAADRTAVRIAIAPVQPCREEDMVIAVEGRAPVADISELQPRAGVLRTGAAVPEMPLTGLDGAAVNLKDLMTPSPEYQPAPPVERLVLLLARQTQAQGEGIERRLGGVRLAALAAEMRRLERESFLGDPASRDAPLIPPMAFAQVLVFETAPAADALLATLRAERERWGDHLAWTTEPRSTVDLFAVGGESMAIVLDRGRRLVAAIPITDSTTGEQVADQIALALMEAAEETSRP